MGAKLKPLRDAAGKAIEGALAEKTFVEVGGLRQGIFIRGERRDNPVVLYLHGGPGTPLLPFIARMEKGERLEKYFTVCYWDQRGAGMTYTRSTDPATMTVERMVEDTHEVTEYLRKRFGQRKIHLMGQSWGTYLGVKVIEKYPENYAAYIGIGQIMRQRESERLAYDYMLGRARQAGDGGTVEKLGRFNPDADDFPTLRYLMARTGLLNKYRIGHMRRGVKFMEMAKGVALFRGYTLREKLGWFLGADFSMAHLFDGLLRDDLFRSPRRFSVPVYVMQGAWDYQVSSALADRWLAGIEAPAKGFFTFDDSAHSPNMEEPEKFVNTVRA